MLKQPLRAIPQSFTANVYEFHIAKLSVLIESVQILILSIEDEMRLKIG